MKKKLLLMSVLLIASLPCFALSGVDYYPDSGSHQPLISREADIWLGISMMCAAAMSCTCYLTALWHDMHVRPALIFMVLLILACIMLIAAQESNYSYLLLWLVTSFIAYKRGRVLAKEPDKAW